MLRSRLTGRTPHTESEFFQLFILLDKLGNRNRERSPGHLSRECLDYLGFECPTSRPRVKKMERIGQCFNGSGTEAGIPPLSSDSRPN
jgi:hypothetical protein